MNKTILHFIVDPLCGWTYAAGPLLAASLEQSGLNVRVHGGGMLAGNRRRQITLDWKAFVLPIDQRIAQISGQPFGSAYFDGLLSDTSVLLDSEPPITAMITAQELAGEGVSMLNRIQHAYYFEGQKISNQEVLKSLATEIGISTTEFERIYKKNQGKVTEQHIADTQQLLTRIGAKGFPSVALQDSESDYQQLNISAYYGNTTGWLSYLINQL